MSVCHDNIHEHFLELNKKSTLHYIRKEKVIAIFFSTSYFNVSLRFL